jgi:hypothetical protein
VAKKRKKTGNTPRRKKMSRPARLQSAVHWLQQYDGDSVVKAYAQWYGQGEVGSMIELRMLGLNIGDELIQAAKDKVERKIEANKKAKKKKAEINDFEKYPDSDDTFYFIAGYTSGGAPYGVTWEEAGEIPPWSEN